MCDRITVHANVFEKPSTKTSNSLPISLRLLSRRKLILQIDHTLQTSNFHFLGNIVGQVFGGIRSGAFGYLKRNEESESHLSHQIESLFKNRHRFRVKSAEHVGRNAAIG